MLKWTDPEGFVWRYGYDGVGNILRITDALGGNYDMTYGPRNERLTEKNQDSQTWTYTYDLLARLAIRPFNGTTRTLTYDPSAGSGGRLRLRPVQYWDTTATTTSSLSHARFVFDFAESLLDCSRTRAEQHGGLMWVSPGIRLRVLAHTVRPAQAWFRRHRGRPVRARHHGRLPTYPNDSCGKRLRRAA